MILSQPDPPAVDKTATRQMLKKSPLFDVDVLEKNLTDDMYKPEKERLIICRFCKSFVTTPDTITEINGSHSHTFKNPGGIVYSIGCFLSAKGCLNIGEYTMEFTWFTGYGWCFAICSRCFKHLGWHYRSNGSGFYGLILNNIAENI